MTADAEILYPSIAMAVISMVLIFGLGIRRFIAVRSREVDPRYYRTFSEGAGEPESLRRHSRHVQNHFEVPPLFHLAVWGTYVAGDVTATTVGAAWLFVAARLLHSFIHLTYNHVLQRFVVYGIGVLVVLFLWVELLLSLLA